MTLSGPFILYGWTKDEWAIVLEWYNRHSPARLDLKDCALRDPQRLLRAQYTWLLRNYPLHPERRIVHAQ